LRRQQPALDQAAGGPVALVEPHGGVDVGRLGGQAVAVGVVLARTGRAQVMEPPDDPPVRSAGLGREGAAEALPHRPPAGVDRPAGLGLE